MNKFEHENETNIKNYKFIFLKNKTKSKTKSKHVKMKEIVIKSIYKQLITDDVDDKQETDETVNKQKN